MTLVTAQAETTRAADRAATAALLLVLVFGTACAVGSWWARSTEPTCVEQSEICCAVLVPRTGPSINPGLQCLPATEHRRGHMRRSVLDASLPAPRAPDSI